MKLLWIISDTMRKNCIGAYGNKTVHTPSLDSLAAKSVRFDRHYAAAFPTMPARADFLTGRWTMSYMGWEPLFENETTIGQILSNAGAHTTAVVDTPFYVRRGMNYDRGFKTFHEIPGQYLPKSRGESLDIPGEWRFESDHFAPKTFQKAMQWLERHYKEDFFLYIDTWDPHEPWDAPRYYTELYMPDYDGEVIQPIYARCKDIAGFNEGKVPKALATYLGEVTMVDTWVGYLLRKLENLDIMKETVIIFTTDHGYYFGEHDGLFGKMRQGKPSGRIPQYKDLVASWDHSPLYEELTNIPLIIYVPGVKPGVYSGVTSAIDLMPTVLDSFRLNMPPAVEGRSLLSACMDKATPGREYVVSGLPFTNAGEMARWVDDMPRRIDVASPATITTDEWSLVYAAEPGMSELFNLRSDPLQKTNVIDRNMGVARELHQMFVGFMRETRVPERLVEPRLQLRM